MSTRRVTRATSRLLQAEEQALALVPTPQVFSENNPLPEPEDSPLPDSPLSPLPDEPSLSLDWLPSQNPPSIIDSQSEEEELLQTQRSDSSTKLSGTPSSLSPSKSESSEQSPVGPIAGPSNYRSQIPIRTLKTSRNRLLIADHQQVPIMAARPLPTRTGRDAPKFDGKDESLLRYFADIEQICATANIVDMEGKVNAALFYLSTDDEAIWKSVTTHTTWDNFKDLIKALYPGSNEKKKYLLNDLEVLLAKEVANPINTKSDLGRYHREFTKISAHLLKQERITEGEVKRYYTRGIHPEFLMQVISRLRITKSDHDIDTPYQISDVYDAALYILGGQILYGSGIVSPSPVPSFKTEIDEMSREIKALNREMIANMSTMARTLSNMGTNPNQGYATRPQGYVPQAYRAPNPFVDRSPIRRPPPPAGASSLCTFCSDPTHFIRECPKVAEFIRDGKCMRNNTGRIVLPNGSWVPGNIEGPNLAARITRYHELYPGAIINGVNFVREQPPHASTMWYASASNQGAYYYSGATVEEAEDEDDVGYTLVSEGVKRTTRSTKNTEERPAPAMRRKGPPGRPTPLSDEPSVAPPPKKKSVEFQEPLPENRRSATTGPQYKFSTPIEDPEIAKAVLKRSLDAQFTISQRELLSLSLDVRKQYKELVSTKRIPTVGILESVNPEDEDNPDTSYILRYANPVGPDEEVLLTGSSIEKLRVIYPVIEDEKVECVLDGGSEIIAMNKGLWQRLGIHLRPDHKITMESANSQTDSTTGLIEDLKFSIAGLEIYLKVHVVENAPFDILMGRPFFKLTACVTKDHLSGDQDLTLTCPNTGRVVTLPTFVKPRRGPPASVGFYPVGGNL